MKRKAFELVTAPIIHLFKKANSVNTSLTERIHPIHEIKIDHRTLKFYCPNSLSLWRARTLFSKEPDTIEWINSFTTNDTLYDIGANVGMYSIYAASKGIQVYAFEPESQNYATLNHNIFINQFQDKIAAYNIAVNDVSSLGQLYLKNFLVGGALNSFGKNIDYKNEAFTPNFTQAVASFSLDDLIGKNSLPIPDHIKIDVDGLEHAIVVGGAKLFTQSRLQSVLIELNIKLKADLEVIKILEGYGFNLVSCYRSPAFDHTAYKDIYNHIFRRV